MSVLGFEVSETAELLLWEGVPLAGSVVVGVCGVVAMLTGVSGNGVVVILGCIDALHIP